MVVHPVLVVAGVQGHVLPDGHCVDVLAINYDVRQYVIR